MEDGVGEAEQQSPGSEVWFSDCCLKSRDLVRTFNRCWEREPETFVKGCRAQWQKMDDMENEGVK